MTSEARQGYLFKSVSLCLLTALFAIFFISYFAKNLPDAYAIGCDSYGYLKQKQLFTTHGYLDGLLTAERGAEADFLVSVASKINTNPLNWSEMIAPHCHHYDSATNQIVLQYPPGTGFILSLLPEGKELQTLSVLMVASIVLLYCVANLLVFDFEFFLLSTLVCYVVLATSIKFQVASYSIPVTLTLIPWVAIFLHFLRPETTVRNIVIAIALGTFCGLLVNVRIASVLILPGVAGIFAVKMAQDRRPHDRLAWPIPVIFSVFFGLAIIPLLYANHVNAGGIFNSTYAVYDRELRFNDPGLIGNNVHYYLTDNVAAIVAVMALAFLTLRLGRDNKQLTSAQRLNLYLLLLVFLGNLAFFCLKPVAIDYYFLPVSVFCLCFGLLDYSQSSFVMAGTRFSKVKTPLATLLILLLGGGLAYQILVDPPKKHDLRIPDSILNRQDIVYAGITGGTINYYFGKYTSKLDFGTYCMAEQLLTRVARSGRNQYIVDDTPKMNALIHDIGIEKFAKVGVFKDLTSSYVIYKFDASRATEVPPISCDLTVNDELAGNVALKLSGHVSGATFDGLVTLTNNSETSFSTRPVAGPVKLSWRFVDTKNSGNPPPWEARKDLTMLIVSKHSYEIPFKIDLPKNKGEYLLEVTLVQEGFSWFNDYGMSIPTQTVIVE